MSGFCDFCQMWHSGSCCHPGQATLHGYKRALAANQIVIDEMKAALRHAHAELIHLGAKDDDLDGIPRESPACKKIEAILGPL